MVSKAMANQAMVSKAMANQAMVSKAMASIASTRGASTRLARRYPLYPAQAPARSGEPGACLQDAPW
jgi:hypothetical protein